MNAFRVLMSGPSALLITIAVCALCIALGVVVFWAFERVEETAPIVGPARTWSRWENVFLGVLIAGILIRLWFVWAVPA